MTFEGVENVKAAVLGFHEPLDDFHIVLEEFVFDGTLGDGHAATRFQMRGNWVRPIGGVIQPTKVGVEIAIAAYIFYKIKNEKITAINVVASPSAVPEFEGGLISLAKAYQAQMQQK